MSEVTSGLGFEVTHEELIRDIVDAYERQKPLFVWGRTGIGKSYTVKRAAKLLAKKYELTYTEVTRECDKEHFGLIDRRLANRDPTDIIGILDKSQFKKQFVVDVEEAVEKINSGEYLYVATLPNQLIILEEVGQSVARWALPDWLPEEGRGIIFLDELPNAPPIVQNAAYSLILDRMLEDYILPDGWVVLAAGNVAEDRAFTFDMTPPLRTRFHHVVLKIPSLEEWFEWARSNSIDGRILAFLKLNPALIYKFIEEDRTFPTPRGWENASCLMKDKDGDCWRAVAKYCGVVAGLQFRDFMKLSEQIDLNTVLNNPEKLLGLEVSLRFSVIANLTYVFGKYPEKYGEKLMVLASSLFTGIYDIEKLKEYSDRIIERNKLYEEGKDTTDIDSKLSSMLGQNRQSEYATLILVSMKTSNAKEFYRLMEESKYSEPLADLYYYLV